MGLRSRLVGAALAGLLAACGGEDPELVLNLRYPEAIEVAMDWGRIDGTLPSFGVVLDEGLPTEEPLWVELSELTLHLGGENIRLAKPSSKVVFLVFTNTESGLDIALSGKVRLHSGSTDPGDIRSFKVEKTLENEGLVGEIPYADNYSADFSLRVEQGQLDDLKTSDGDLEYNAQLSGSLDDDGNLEIILSLEKI